MEEWYSWHHCERQGYLQAVKSVACCHDTPELSRICLTGPTGWRSLIADFPAVPSLHSERPGHCVAELLAPARSLEPLANCFRRQPFDAYCHGRSPSVPQPCFQAVREACNQDFFRQCRHAIFQRTFQGHLASLVDLPAAIVPHSDGLADSAKD